MTSLRSGYDALLLDLDGTLYQGAQAIPGAVEALARGDQRLYYVTNNASRSPESVSTHLTELGFDSDPSRVVTSSQSAARLLSETVDRGSAVLVVGTDALCDEIAHVGLRPVRRFEDDPVAVVQGHSVATGWEMLAEATLAIRGGARWVATNVDTTLPTERGLTLGNGSMVAAVATASGREPLVAGKPAEPIMQDALTRSGAQRPLVVGDRLDTDIEGANAVGIDSLLVLSGVSTVAEVLRAPASQRPTFIGRELAVLDEDVDDVRVAGAEAWNVTFDGSDLVVESAGDAADERDVDLVRALAHVAWKYPEFGGIVPADPPVRVLLERWGL
ncbi:HAD-IIA family hydrolase [Rhodococcus sp. NPDC058521]|uniref:HAD-IIA family hydrolase n=1 Tax=Rhodococcus sp. NPDC058521 TaxID=3346536 RepID=UPI00364B831C